MAALGSVHNLSTRGAGLRVRRGSQLNYMFQHDH